jgi:hypothetical protein
MILSLKEWRARAAASAAAAADLKARLAPRLGLGPDDAVSVREAACPDPGCPDRETIVLVMRAGERTRALRATCPPEEVGTGEIEALVAEERARREAGAD